MSALNMHKAFDPFEITFVKKRFGHPAGYLNPEDLKIGKTYDIQYGDIKILEGPVELCDVVTGSSSTFIRVQLRIGGVLIAGWIDLVWIGVVSNSDGLWAENAFCYDFYFKLLQVELI